MKDLMWLEINLNNLIYNIKNLRALLKPGTKFMAVVKANAYGHGMVEAAKASLKAGANWLGVVNLTEGLELRANDLKAPILVMGYIKPTDFILAAKNNISIAIINFEQLKKAISYQSSVISQQLKIHLKIETGINRLGFSEEEWPRLIKELKNLPQNIIIEGIYSHFASVEEHDLNYAKKQVNQFKKFKRLFESDYKLQATSYKLLWHIAASAATMILPESHFDMVRCGISIYGLWPSREIASVISQNSSTHQLINLSTDFLKPVLSYKTKIVQIKEIKKGDFIGYGCTYRAKKDMTIAVLPVGYYEGVDRRLSNLGEVLVASKKCPIIGRICMNMTTIDISQLRAKGEEQRVEIGDEVALIGEQTIPTPVGSGPRSASIGADEWAEKLGTINYEITTRIPAHIKRVYIG